MTYVKAILAAVVAALAVGVATGGVVGVLHGLKALTPADEATVLAATIGEAANCAPWFIVLLVPLAVVLVFTVRLWRRRAPPGRLGGGEARRTP